MDRLHLFELEDFPWFPKGARDADTDLLRFAAGVRNPYRAIIPRLKDALERSGADRIVDLCSGGGGPMLAMAKSLAEGGWQGRITLTDKFPNHAAFDYVRSNGGGNIDVVPGPVDATRVPEHLNGLRTLFTSLHHFSPDMVRNLLEDAVGRRQPIAAFEMSERSLSLIVAAALINPPTVMLVMPFVRPFRWSRLFWTYMLPLVPVSVLWDGVVSCLRSYTTSELEEIVSSIDAPGYTWEIGREPGKPAPVTYLIGLPV